MQSPAIIPAGLHQLLHSVTVAVLRAQPPDLYDFITAYFVAKRAARRAGHADWETMDWQPSTTTSHPSASLEKRVSLAQSGERTDKVGVSMTLQTDVKEVAVAVPGAGLLTAAVDELAASAAVYWSAEAAISKSEVALRRVLSRRQVAKLTSIRTQSLASAARRVSVLNAIRRPSNYPEIVAAVENGIDGDPDSVSIDVTQPKTDDERRNLIELLRRNPIFRLDCNYCSHFIYSLHIFSSIVGEFL